MSEIKTTHLNPPIPIRDWDWCAYRDGSEEDGIRGFGSSEQKAIDDLLKQESDEWGDCDWCQKGLSDEFIQIEGYHFCDEKCESDFYGDKNERKKNGKLPLLIERKRLINRPI